MAGRAPPYGKSSAEMQASSRPFSNATSPTRKGWSTRVTLQGHLSAPRGSHVRDTEASSSSASGCSEGRWGLALHLSLHLRPRRLLPPRGPQAPGQKGVVVLAEPLPSACTAKSQPGPLPPQRDRDTRAPHAWGFWSIPLHLRIDFHVKRLQQPQDPLVTEIGVFCPHGVVNPSPAPPFRG